MEGLRSFAGLLCLVAAAAVASTAAAANGHGQKVCKANGNGDEVTCHAEVVVDAKGDPLAGPTPNATALTPADFQSAYLLPSSTAGAGQTIAIVDAFDYPTASADLDVFSRQYGLPLCNTSNGCLRIVNQDGGTNLRKIRTDAGWALEAALDLQTAHGVCPNCKLLFVEARTNSFLNLGAAVNTAAALGANVISNSYGAPESSGSSSYDSYYNHPGVAITVSTGDNGYAVEAPASAPTVTAVGGTTLTRSGSSWTESAWSGAGSGCSLYEAKPAWQTSATLCGRRANADVSADADPVSGASIYDSTAYNGTTGWYKVGGTSLAAPLVAGVYGLAANSSSTSYPVSLAWSHASALNDVTSGSNGTCATSLWCTAAGGWDGPTGLGTPNGVGAF